MQKISLFACMMVASLVLTGCTLLGGTAETEAPVVRDTNGSSESLQGQDAAVGTTESVTPVDTSEAGAQLPAAQSDPSAEQKAMMEAQNDAPTGVPTQ